MYGTVVLKLRAPTYCSQLFIETYNAARSRDYHMMSREAHIGVLRWTGHIVAGDGPITVRENPVSFE